MRKKEILSNFVKNPDVVCTHSIIKLGSKPETYSALITFLPGSRGLESEVNGRMICLAGAGYKWLMYLPMDEYWCLSTYYTPDDVLIGWYFDISRRNFLDENGMPCIDDIFLDIAISSDGQIATLDADELQDALDENVITIQDYNHAYYIHNQIINSRWCDTGFLSKLSETLMSNYV